LSFEVTSKDLLGRIGTIDTKSGKIETPHLLPVVNPLTQPISPEDILKIFRCNAIITNAYLVKKNLANEALANGIHRVLDYDSIVVTELCSKKRLARMSPLYWTFPQAGQLTGPEQRGLSMRRSEEPTSP